MIADFTKTNIYWKQLSKNLNKLMLGLQNYKLPKQKSSGSEAKRHAKKSKAGHKYDFSKSHVAHNFFTIYLQVLQAKAKEQQNFSQKWQGLKCQVNAIFDELFFYGVHSDILDPLFTENLVNWRLS